MADILCIYKKTPKYKCFFVCLLFVFSRIIHLSVTYLAVIVLTNFLKRHGIAQRFKFPTLTSLHMHKSYLAAIVS